MNLENQIKLQCKKAFFDKLKEDFNKEPPDTKHIKMILNELSDALCKFVPSKPKFHDKIRSELLLENVSLETMPYILSSLIKWIEMFQAPIYDEKTRAWRQNFKTCDNCTDFIVTFLQEYYEHLEQVYKEVWDARKRLVTGESVVPPEHRKQVKNINDINMKSGRY